ncbi:MAG: hemolysin III family protein, partial [Clostridia bacterium]|nr:hemolysin III family protein [Clostridia bacterium]
MLDKVTLPSYTKGEELFNSVSHGVGILFGIFTMIFCILNSTTGSGIWGSVVFAASSIVLYFSSTMYHALTKEKIKKVF